MKRLTTRQRDILAFIDEFHRRENVPPTVYEIATHFEIKPATSFAHLRALQRKGYIERTSKARSLTLLKTPHRKSNPMSVLLVPILGKISAGLPLLSEEHVEDKLKLDPSMLPWGIGRQKLFALRIKGDSMRDAGILDGDLIVARAQETALDGEIVVALVDGESTIKYLHYTRDKQIELRPANPAYKSRFYSPDEIVVQGVMASLLRTC